MFSKKNYRNRSLSILQPSECICSPTSFIFCIYLLQMFFSESLLNSNEKNYMPGFNILSNTLSYCNMADVTSVKLAHVQPLSTTLLISSVPPLIYMFIGQFGAADCVPGISFSKLNRLHIEIWIWNFKWLCCEVSTTTFCLICKNAQNKPNDGEYR